MQVIQIYKDKPPRTWVVARINNWFLESSHKLYSMQNFMQKTVLPNEAFSELSEGFPLNTFEAKYNILNVENVPSYTLRLLMDK